MRSEVQTVTVKQPPWPLSAAGVVLGGAILRSTYLHRQHLTLQHDGLLAATWLLAWGILNARQERFGARGWHAIFIALPFAACALLAPVNP